MNNIIKLENIQELFIDIRGQKVSIDSDFTKQNFRKNIDKRIKVGNKSKFYFPL